MLKRPAARCLLLTLLSLCSPLLWADPAFELTVLGDSGGIKDGNLTAFLLRAEQDQNYLALDAGTLVNGLEIAAAKGAFSHSPVPADSDLSPAGYMLKEKIKGYIISHSHLDHVGGLVIASPEDSRKNIYALAGVNRALAGTYFNWIAWPNFADQGEGFRISQYHYVDLAVGMPRAIDGTSLTVSAFPVNHPVESGAFILENKGDVVAFFGDTGPDAVERSNQLHHIWQTLAPRVKSKQLKGLIIEVSFANDTPDNALFGHLTPRWLLHELAQLELAAGGKGSLQGVKVVIQHIKYSLKKDQAMRTIIRQQLDEGNTLGVEFILATQGEVIAL